MVQPEAWQLARGSGVGWRAGTARPDPPLWRPGRSRRPLVQRRRRASYSASSGPTAPARPPLWGSSSACWHRRGGGPLARTIDGGRDVQMRRTHVRGPRPNVSSPVRRRLLTWRVYVGKLGGTERGIGAPARGHPEAPVAGLHDRWCLAWSPRRYAPGVDAAQVHVELVRAELLEALV